MDGLYSPREVIERFYAAEAIYMNEAGADAGASFAAMAATLDPDVVLHQSPDLPWGGEFRGHAGYEDWAWQMSRAFDRLEVKNAHLFTAGETVVNTCRLVTRARASGETLDLPMVQVVRVRGERIVEFRPFYWNVPAYRKTVGSARESKTYRPPSVRSGPRPPRAGSGAATSGFAANGSRTRQRSSSTG